MSEVKDLAVNAANGIDPTRTGSPLHRHILIIVSVLFEILITDENVPKDEGLDGSVVTSLDVDLAAAVTAPVAPWSDRRTELLLCSF